MSHTMLVVLPHPDDESFPMGGTLAKYAAEGVRITLICATLGELGIPDKPPAEAAVIRERELRAAAAILGIGKVQFMRYQDGSLANVDRGNIISYVTNAMRRLGPQVIITFGPDGISGHPDHVAISSLVTEAFDRATLKSYLPDSRLYYLAPSEATLQGCGVTPSQKIAGGPVASIDITDYRLPKVRAMQAHVSQDPPYTGDPVEEADKLTCHEYFTLARPATADGELNDLFAY